MFFNIADDEDDEDDGGVIAAFLRSLTMPPSALADMVLQDGYAEFVPCGLELAEVRPVAVCTWSHELDAGLAEERPDVISSDAAISACMQGGPVAGCIESHELDAGLAFECRSLELDARRANGYSAAISACEKGMVSGSCIGPDLICCNAISSCEQEPVAVGIGSLGRLVPDGISFNAAMSACEIGFSTAISTCENEVDAGLAVEPLEVISYDAAISACMLSEPMAAGAWPLVHDAGSAVVPFGKISYDAAISACVQGGVEPEPELDAGLAGGRDQLQWRADQCLRNDGQVAVSNRPPSKLVAGSAGRGQLQCEAISGCERVGSMAVGAGSQEFDANVHASGSGRAQVQSTAISACEQVGLVAVCTGSHELDVVSRHADASKFDQLQYRHGACDGLLPVAVGTGSLEVDGAPFPSEVVLPGDALCVAGWAPQDAVVMRPVAVCTGSPELDANVHAGGSRRDQLQSTAISAGETVDPDEISYSAVISACASPGEPPQDQLQCLDQVVLSDAWLAIDVEDRQRLVFDLLSSLSGLLTSEVVEGVVESALARRRG